MLIFSFVYERHLIGGLLCPLLLLRETLLIFSIPHNSLQQLHSAYFIKYSESPRIDYFPRYSLCISLNSPKSKVP